MLNVLVEMFVFAHVVFESQNDFADCAAADPELVSDFRVCPAAMSVKRDDGGLSRPVPISSPLEYFFLLYAKSGGD